MLLFIRFFLALYGIIALATGFMAMTSAYDPGIFNAMDDNNHRYIAAIWAAMSLAFFYVAWNPSETTLFRFVMIALIIGGVVRAVALINYPATPVLLFLILLELIPPAIMLWMHAKLLKSGVL